MTEQYPPLNYERHGKLRGISVDLLELMIKEMGGEQTREAFHLYPWPRAYGMIKNQPNQVLFCMSRNEEREMQFKWVGPIIPSEIVIFAKKSKGIVINDPSDLTKFKRIGVVKSDIGELLLKSKMNTTQDQIYYVKNSDAGINMLTANRLELFAYERIVGLWTIREIGLNPDDYEAVYTLSSSDYYYAFSLDVPDELIQKFQKTLEKLKKRGELDHIIKNYY